VLRFGTSRERCIILDGLLRYRAALHAEGLVSGFQWIDGSFLEQVEQIEERPPNDVDVVTFFRLSAENTAEAVLARNPDLFDAAKTKVRFHVDAYVVQLDTEAAFLVGSSAYWYSVWSHRRDGSWKGFVQVDLGPGELPAIDLLKTLPAGGAP
jgi:hypothetical protein